MVKSENLMLGDWVLEGRDLFLKFITSLGIREEYTPISLNDRILEKHGFEKIWIGNRFFHRYVTKKYVVEIYLELGLIRISTVCNNHTLYDGEIEYVHELQHLMKMFDIMVIDMRGCGFNEKSLVIERERNIKWMNLYENKVGIMFSPTLYKSRTDAEETKSDEVIVEGKMYSYYDTVMVILNEEK